MPLLKIMTNQQIGEAAAQILGNPYECVMAAIEFIDTAPDMWSWNGETF